MTLEKINVLTEGSQPYANATLYLIDASDEFMTNVRPLIIVCPGGGYGFTSDREAEVVALQFNAMGYHAAVLRYSVAPARFPTALLEVGQVVLQARANSEKWHIDPDRIAVVGFSAGGHLACSYGCLWSQKWVAEKLNAETEQLRPNGMILGYPVITSGEKAHHGSFHNLLGDEYDAKKAAVSLENCISEDVPPAFIWHTWEDGAVPVENSILLASALAEKKIPAELHIFQHGQHGLGLANWVTQSRSGACVEPPAQQWIPLVRTWLEGWRKHD
ncbi:MAG: alpha/beta hydrolase [Clostridia bacterium]|nr:alpha/beta hydrolase [Clostridia bacterium]